MAYKSYNKKEIYPWCLKLGIALNLDSCYENGLPEASETAIANQLEDELLGKIKKLATAHYIGHLFNDTFLDVYIYLDNPEKVHQYLQTQINKEGLVRGIGYEINKDPTWSTVKNYLRCQNTAYHADCVNLFLMIRKFLTCKAVGLVHLVTLILI